MFKSLQEPQLLITKNVVIILIFDRTLHGKALSRDFLPINMHGKCGFGSLNHIHGRVKIVLGKKKADKHTVWAPGEVAQHPVCQFRCLSAVYVHRYIEYVRGAEEYFAGDIPK